ncbi:uncharacterized protein [Palaemon carinicauda]|uniref:uncharacterized protein n=1 Tax=Palaemon carinicauda TaxID=392227 RepID=UPI0035B65149
MSDSDEIEEVEGSSTGNVTPPPSKKKKQYRQAFKREWMNHPELHWVRKDPEEAFSAWCAICKHKLSNVNKSALFRHNHAKKHLKNLAKKEPGSVLVELKSGSEFMPDQGKVPGLGVQDHYSKVPGLSVQDEIHRMPEYGMPVVLDPVFQGKVSRAEDLLTGFLTEHNMPFRQANELMYVIKKAFPDSEIAKAVSIQLGHYPNEYGEREERPSNQGNRENSQHAQPDGDNEIICRVMD